MTEAWVDEKGCLHVPATPHTCDSFHELQHHVCKACEEAEEFWQSFEHEFTNVKPVTPEPQTWDTAHDCVVYEVDPVEVWS